MIRDAEVRKNIDRGFDTLVLSAAALVIVIERIKTSTITSTGHLR